jgi:hypothetical protein
MKRSKKGTVDEGLQITFIHAYERNRVLQWTSVCAPSELAMSRVESKDRPVLLSAPPPWHAVALVVTCIGVFVYRLPSWTSIDEAATVETFTRRLFPELISIQQLALVRILFAALIWGTSLQTACISNGWQQTSSYLPGSKLLRVPNTLSGIKTMFPFTSVSWNILGLAFSLSGYIAWHTATITSSSSTTSSLIPVPLLRAALIVWEIAAPNTLLVAAVIRYAIWPAVLSSSSGDTTNLKSVRNILMHNVNVVLAVTETALLGGIPVRWSDWALGPLLGCAYIIFSWTMSTSWNDTAAAGPQFIYFFFDTTLPGYAASKFLMALLVVLMVFFGVFCSAGSVLMAIDGGLLTHVLFTLMLCSAVVRFRD